MDQDHDAYARSLVICWPHEMVPALAWAELMRRRSPTEVMLGMAAFIEAVYGKWAGDKKPNWSNLSGNMSIFFTSLSPCFDPMQLGWSSVVTGVTGANHIFAQRTGPAIYNNRGQITGLKKTTDLPLVTVVSRMQVIHEEVTQIEDFPKEAAYAMCWAILYHRSGNNQQLTKMREWYLGG